MSALAKALLAFQKDPPHVGLDATNPHFHSKFASLGGVVQAVRPALTKHGLVVTQLPTVTADGSSAVETRLIHADSGEELSSVMPLVLVKTDPQAQGSALTYARRYALLSVLGLVADEDDDGNSAQPVTDTRATDNGHTSEAAVPVGDVTFTFGKHKGLRVNEVPTSYLEWWLTSDSAKSERNQELRFAVEAHLGLTSVKIAGGAAEIVLSPSGTGASDMDDIPFAASEF